MAQFVSRQFIVDEVNAVNPGTLTLANITTSMIKRASQELIERTGYDWIVKGPGYVMKLDGEGNDWIFTKIKPILGITNLKIYNSDRSEYEDVDEDDIGDKFDIDYDTGYIQTVKSTDWTVAAAVFLEGVQNVEITGSFGVDGASHEMIKDITMLMVMRRLQMLNPTDFQFDIIRERLGKYEYQTSTSGVSKANEKLSVDGLINLLIDNLVYVFHNQ